MTYSLGIPDNKFLRGPLPMTKEEIRIITIAKSKIKHNSIVYDIGSGTGSLTIEAAQLARDGQVFAIEKSTAGVELTKANLELFCVKNVRVIHTEAPIGLAGLPPADNIIIGGSGGNLAEILQVCQGQLNSGGRIVINAITLETLWLSINFLEKANFQEVEAVALNIARLNKVGQTHMWQGLNPVYIIYATKL